MASGRCASNRFLKPVSYAVLGCASLYSIFNYRCTSEVHTYNIGLFGFILFFTLGLLGIWRTTKLIPCKCRRNDRIEDIQKEDPTLHLFFKHLTFLAEVYALPALVTDIYLRAGVSFELAMAHLMLPIFAVLPYFTKKQENKEVQDFILFVMGVSLSLVSILNGDPYGPVAAIDYAFTHFIITKQGKILNVSAAEFYNYGLAIFCYMALQAVNNVEPEVW